MNDVRLQWLLRTQDDLVASWQLGALGWSARMIHDRATRHRWQRIHEGVYALTRAPLRRRQRWIAATLTAPGTVLYAASAAACWGFRRWSASFEMVVRHGSGGPEMLDGVRVSRSSALPSEITWCRGIPITTVERTLIDLSPSLGEEARARAMREAIRLGLTTADDILGALDRHRGWRGTRALRVRAERYAMLPIERTRSDAEGMALELNHLAGGPVLESNVAVGAYEADLVDHANRRIYEIDGPQFHLFPEEDERRDEDWTGEGYEVTRIPSPRIYHSTSGRPRPGVA